MSKSHVKSRAVNHHNNHSVNGDACDEGHKKSPSVSSKRTQNQHHSGQEVDVGHKVKKSEKSDKAAEVTVENKSKRGAVNINDHSLNDSQESSVILRPRTQTTRRCISDSVKSDNTFTVNSNHSETEVSNIRKSTKVGRFNLTPIVSSSIPKISGGANRSVASKIFEHGKLEADHKCGDSVDSSVPVRVARRALHSNKSPHRSGRQPKKMQGNKNEGLGHPNPTNQKDNKADVNSDASLQQANSEKVSPKDMPLSPVENGTLESKSVAAADLVSPQNDTNVSKPVVLDAGASDEATAKPAPEKVKSPGRDRKTSVTFASDVKDDVVPEPVKTRTVSEESKDEDNKSSRMSPDHRFMKLDEEVGRGSFKTVHKGLEIDTGVHVAWCELQVRFLFKNEN